MNEEKKAKILEENRQLEEVEDLKNLLKETKDTLLSQRSLTGKIFGGCAILLAGFTLSLAIFGVFQITQISKAKDEIFTLKMNFEEFANKKLEKVINAHYQKTLSEKIKRYIERQSYRMDGSGSRLIDIIGAAEVLDSDLIVLTTEAEKLFQKSLNEKTRYSQNKNDLSRLIRIYSRLEHHQFFDNFFQKIFLNIDRIKFDEIDGSPVRDIIRNYYSRNFKRYGNSVGEIIEFDLTKRKRSENLINELANLELTEPLIKKVVTLIMTHRKRIQNFHNNKAVVDMAIKRNLIKEFSEVSFNKRRTTIQVRGSDFNFNLSPNSYLGKILVDKVINNNAMKLNFTEWE